MELENFGFTEEFGTYIINHSLSHFHPARVILEHKERYVVVNEEGEFEAEILGNLRFSAQSRADFPAVGDWVCISKFDENKALIHHVLPRKSVIERQSVGQKGEKQIIASNIDMAFIVQAVDRDYSMNRIERYLTICHAGGVDATVILNKTDLIDEPKLSELINELKVRLKNIPVFAISNANGTGIADLKKMILKGKTYCLLGSSGVGKSTLVNSLLGKELMQTKEISEFTNRGKHVTTHRELILLPEGGIIIDNPGMREVGVTDSSGGIEATFDVIYELAQTCRYSDCTHDREEGCAVKEALDNGELDPALYENYMKIEREKEFFGATVAEKRKKDKDFGKMVKEFKKKKYKGY